MSIVQGDLHVLSILKIFIKQLGFFLYFFAFKNYDQTSHTNKIVWNVLVLITFPSNFGQSIHKP